MALTREEQLELQQLEQEEIMENGPQSGMLGRFNAGDASVKQRIIERGDESFAEAKQGFKDASGGFSKTMAGLNLAAMPFERYEAGIANVAMSLQDGTAFSSENNMIDEFMLGVRGKKLGEIGDVYRKAGAPEWAAKTIGLTTTMLPIVGTVWKSTNAIAGIRGLGKFTDRGLRIAGNSLVKGADDAVNFIGSKVDDAYKTVNKIGIEIDDMLKASSDIPELVLKRIEKQLGKGIEFVENIEEVRKVKSILGRLKSKSFGKGERGIAETFDDIDINKAYKNLKELIQKTLNNRGLEKRGKAILEMDDAFHDTQGAADLIRSSVMNPKLFKPTKAGKVAKKLKVTDDFSTRDAINTLLKAGKKSKKAILTAVDKMNEYNAISSAIELGRKVINYSLLGGVAGSIGSRSFRNAMGDGDDFGGEQ